MITIEAPSKKIDKVWGKQKPQTAAVYRKMKYILRIDHEQAVALLNIVTGELVVLNEQEIKLFDELPCQYSDALIPLIESHFLVPENYDEHKQVCSLRKILQRMEPRKKDITSYTIFPTTACNARCYYCFEAGTKYISMSEQTASDVVSFIADHCGEAKQVFLAWFGGEPTVGADRINQICQGLSDRAIQYTSTMTSNAYLLDEAMMNTAVDLWHLQRIQVSIDGTEENTNKIKSFVGSCENPYQKILTNIGFLLEKGIDVNLRMNYDRNNYRDFEALVREVKQRYPDTSHLTVHVHPVVGTYTNPDGRIDHGDNEWFQKTIVELNALSRAVGLYGRNTLLPTMKYTGCQASSDSAITINAKGELVCCPEQFGIDQVTGNIRDGIIYPSVKESWKRFADYPKCWDCFCYPHCLRLENCMAGDRCDYRLECIQQFQKSVAHKLKTY